MADPKNLSDRDLHETLIGTALVGDLTRAAGLELAAEIAELRAEQADIEAARLRFRKGKDAPEAALPQAAAKARADRREAAATIGAELRKDLERVRDRTDRPDPGGSSERDPFIDRQDIFGPRRDRGFRLAGRVVGSEAPSGLKVGLRVAGSGKPVLNVAPDRDGTFMIEIPDVAEFRKRQEVDESLQLTVTVVVRSGNRIVAHDETPIPVIAGSGHEVLLSLK